jgi:hypothetical protein
MRLQTLATVDLSEGLGWLLRGAQPAAKIYESLRMMIKLLLLMMMILRVLGRSEVQGWSSCWLKSRWILLRFHYFLAFNVLEQGPSLIHFIA